MPPYIYIEMIIYGAAGSCDKGHGKGIFPGRSYGSGL